MEFTPLAIGIFVISLCVGSFLNVVIHRTPLIMRREWRHESAEFWQNEPDLSTTAKQDLAQAVANDAPISLSFPRSRCPNCGYQITALDNIPIVSWLLLKGKCKGCGDPISARYPLVELATALLSILVIYHFGATLQGVLALIFAWILIALTGIDFDTQLLPDRLVYPLGMIGLLANSQALFTSPTSALLGGVFGFLSLWSVARVYALLTKKDGMGAGDFKLLGALGAWLGLAMLPLLILLSSFLGAVVGGALMVKNGGSKPFAFGPYIAIAGFIALLFGQPLIDWYLGFYAR